MQNNINKLAIAIAAASAALISGQAAAGGFQLNEQSVSSQGTAFAGRTSNVTDASIVFGNPAGMSFLDRAQITAGATYLNVNTDIDNASGTTALGTPVTPASNEGDMVPSETIPFGYFVQPINDHLHFGLGVYAPFGVVTDYEDDFEGRYFGNYSDVKVMTVQPTLSIKFSDQLSAGFGITYNRIEGELESATYGGPFGDGSFNVQGDDEAFGFTFGMMYKPVESTTLGVTYRSDVDYELEGDAEINNVYPGAGPGTLPNASYDAGLDITLPETIDFSVTHDLNDRWTVMAGAALVKWSSFDRLVIENDSPLGDQTENQDYEDAWQYALGVAYHVNPAVTLRGGVAYDESPISDEVRTVRVPSGDRTIFSLGAGWTPTPNLTLDFAYTYLTEDTAPVSQQSQTTAASYEADYENEAHGFGAQATYRF
ncbi:outer membrane protein transport protein [Halomonas sp. HP20-15]|uniref:OmpP1/FadL family transporter n=1 Tax=Halomonas sp. HP20-15 TaxID=3085901 RepID=UPI0029810C15|nr:TonB-dependent receptor [Halomonas sp. HP20-15]MDW5376259.1 outer membrane protein transport protein [Halomonas sp. HP20-15]